MTMPSLIGVTAVMDSGSFPFIFCAALPIAMGLPEYRSQIIRDGSLSRIPLFSEKTVRLFDPKSMASFVPGKKTASSP